jgi:hypothetical protein
MTFSQDFVEADHAVSFSIRLAVPENFQQEFSLNNKKTNEKLVIKLKVKPYEKILLITRHALNAAKHKIEKDEREILEWNQYRGPKRICLDI